MPERHTERPSNLPVRGRHGYKRTKQQDETWPSGIRQYKGAGSSPEPFDPYIESKERKQNMGAKAKQEIYTARMTNPNKRRWHKPPSTPTWHELNASYQELGKTISFQHIFKNIIKLSDRASRIQSYTGSIVILSYLVRTTQRLKNASRVYNISPSAIEPHSRH